MAEKSGSSKAVFWVIGVIAAVAIVIGVGTSIYLNLIRDEEPAPLTETPSAEAPAAPLGDISGRWAPAPTSQVGYRVPEILFGQETTAVGRTSAVTGNLTVAGRTVEAVELQADMASVKSDQDRRDNQFRTRIMATSQYPTATYKLDQPIELQRVPDATAQSVKATGTLTLRGVAKPVTSDLMIRQVASGVEVSGLVPVKFADYNIPSPSFGPAQVGDSGELELKVVFTKNG